MTDRSHWTQHAQRWRHIGPPLRPCAEDLAYLAAALPRHFPGQTQGFPARALLCGVTPELARLRLPLTMELLAFDQSQAMIDAVWPGDDEQRRARVGDWFALDLADASVSLALGDGCFTLLDYPHGYRRFAASLARVLVQGGLFSIRLFCRPLQRELPEAVFTALEAGEIGSFHAFKWRLAMALQGDEVGRGVAVDAVWRAFHQRWGEASLAATRIGFQPEHVQTIDNYRGSASIYTYPTVQEVTEQLSEDFELIEQWRGDYELAERCPQLLFRRR